MVQISSCKILVFPLFPTILFSLLVKIFFTFTYHSRSMHAIAPRLNLLLHVHVHVNVNVNVNVFFSLKTFFKKIGTLAECFTNKPNIKCQTNSTLNKTFIGTLTFAYKCVTCHTIFQIKATSITQSLSL